ncbi:thermonuclease family protein [Staphylococcus chromogenes]|uniref:thermonuclease family protein n=1 Tax=Staphylococcus chromogenes TaxID=46126 RepID=UPI003B009D79
MKIDERLNTYKAKVLRVVDGDTLSVIIDLGFKTHAVRTLRLIGVDTPERGKPGYFEAKEFTAQAVDGADIYVQTYKADAFGRYLANVWYTDDNGNEYRLSHELRTQGLIKDDSKWNKEDK